MNINLKGTASKQTKKIGFGLNNRKKSKKKSVFNDSSDEDEDSTAAAGGKGDTATARQIFNKELAAEQAALRSRAEKAMLSATTANANANNDANANAYANNVNDYDAEYESFGHHEHKNAQEKSPASKQTGAKPQSKYVQSLLEKAKERTYEREIVLERKIAKEQAQEEATEAYKGKDKFVTKNYKKKLLEREEWLQQEEKKQKRDEHEDVTKKVAGAAIMGFYGNLSRIGGGADDPRDRINGEGGTDKTKNSFNNQATEYDDHDQRNSMPNSAVTSSSQHRRNIDECDEVIEDVELEEELDHQSKRIKRLHMIFRARERYFERKADREATVSGAQ